jgi:hypothetical protein
LINTLKLPEVVTSSKQTYRSARAETIRVREAFLQARETFYRALGAFIGQEALPLFSKATSPQDYTQMLRAVFDSLNLEITRLILVTSNSPDLLKLQQEGKINPNERQYRMPTPDNNYFVIQRKITMNLVTAEPYCLLLVEGADPDQCIYCFEPLLTRGIAQALANWQPTNP